MWIYLVFLFEISRRSLETRGKREVRSEIGITVMRKTDPIRDIQNVACTVNRANCFDFCHTRIKVLIPEASS